MYGWILAIPAIVPQKGILNILEEEKLCAISTRTVIGRFKKHLCNDGARLAIDNAARHPGHKRDCLKFCMVE